MRIDREKAEAGKQLGPCGVSEKHKENTPLPLVLVSKGAAVKNLNKLFQNKALQFFLCSLTSSPMSLKFTTSVGSGVLVGAACSLISRLAEEQESDGADLS